MPRVTKDGATSFYTVDELWHLSPEQTEGALIESGLTDLTGLDPILIMGLFARAVMNPVSPEAALLNRIGITDSARLDELRQRLEKAFPE